VTYPTVKATLPYSVDSEPVDISKLRDDNPQIADRAEGCFVHVEQKHRMAKLEVEYLLAHVAEERLFAVAVADIFLPFGLA
jgi:hypothetical protein